MFVRTEGEQMEECDDTASPNDESHSENADSDVDPNNSLSYDSHHTFLIAKVLHRMRSTFVR